MEKLDFSKQIMICDGAMGTMIIAAGVEIDGNAAELNLANPDVIEGIQRSYVEAGATCVVSNCFVPRKATSEAEREHFAEAIAASVRIARQSGARFVFGDMGPCGEVLEPLGDATFDDCFAIYQEHARALADTDIDAILLETFIDIADLRCAIFAVRSVSDAPIIASCTFNTSKRMPLSGTSPAAAAVILDALGVDVIGTNCGLGPAQLLEVLEEMRDHTDKPLLVQPNAGLPIVNDDGSTTYPGTPEEMGSYARSFAGLGATIIGSCCGSNPSFTDAISDALQGVLPVSFHRREGIVELSNVSDSKAVTPGFFDMLDSDLMEEGGVIVDCSDVDEYFDILEEISSPFMVFEHSDDIEMLELCLKHYPGRAAVRGVADDEAIAVAKRYGAYVI